ncbi:MAG: glycosyl transferase [Sulfuritalea sp.]|nr:glycosyl transferase [Sulfuritalea sp.]
MSRGGGLGVLLATGIGLWLGDADEALLPGLILVASVAWWDDQRGGVAIKWRIACQLLAATAMAAAGLFPSSGIAFSFLFVIGTIWLCTLYQLMDGADGLVGGMALWGCSALALAASGAGAGASDILVLAECVAAGSAGFLLFNFPPSRILLGSVGSVPLGFLAAVLSLTGVARFLWPWWFPLLVFSPLVVDATVTLAKRVLRGEEISQMHHEHFYQRLMQMGWSDRRLVLSEYVLMLACGISALLAQRAEDSVVSIVLLVWAVIYLALIVLIDKQWRRHMTTTVAQQGHATQ